MPPSFNLSTQPEFHAYTAGLLRKWMRHIDSGKVACHLPRKVGLMRPMPGMHFHLWPELFVQLSGVTHFTFPEEKRRLGPGELCLVPQGLPHGERVVSYRGPFLNLVFAFHPDGIGFHLAGQGKGERPVIVIGSRLEKTPPFELMGLLEDASVSFLRSETDRSLGIKGLLLSHFSVLLAALENSAPSPSSPSFRIARAWQTVMQNLSHPRLSVSWVARRLQTNPDYLSRLFRREVGQPLASYIHRQRMARARELLDFSSLNISEISHATGYTDPSYFTRTFRRLNGATPRVYRKRAKLAFK
jgi:AraC-like DNA-binding protein